MSMHSFRFVVSALGAVLIVACATHPPSLAGIWDATVTVNGLEIPFRMEIAGDAANLEGSFFNGDEKVTSTRGRFDGDELVLEFDEYATRLDATWKDGSLEGKYDRGARGSYPLQAKRFLPVPLTDADPPSIAGLWNLQVKSSKGESAWRLIVRQAGAEVSAAILRVDGDTGTLTGTYRHGVFVLSHFSGARPLLVQITPQSDGTLELIQNGQDRLIAFRDDDPRASTLPQPSDPSRFTSVKDPMAPLRFSFPDLEGRLVSNTDGRFRGRVVLVNITGSWCPNCHDEAPFLAALYRTYRPQGLEIVALSFEEAGQLENPTRLGAFIRRYQIEYPVLLAGEPRELTDKLPQAVNLNSFPTTFFIGRDGLVRGVHAGFPGVASGSFHTQAKAEVTHRIEQLLAEPVLASQ